jgi:precorrin-6B methylase 2
VNQPSSIINIDLLITPVSGNNHGREGSFLLISSRENGLAPIESFKDLMRVSMGFRQARVILSAVETDLFNLIGKSKATSKQVAEKGELEPRAVEIMLDALTGIGLLEKDDGWYSLGEIAAKFLSKDSEDYIGATMLHRSNLWENWSNLSSIIRGEMTDWMRKRPMINDPAMNRSFILCMHDLHYPEALEMCQFLDLKGVEHMVDLGGGAASFSIAFVNCTFGLRSTVIDLPQTLEVAKEVITNFGLEDRIECKVGDIYNDLMLPIGKDVDLFFISNVIHMEGLEENARLMRKVYGSLVKGGRVIINDIMLEESKTSPSDGALFAVNMLVGTERGKSYTTGEIEKMLKDAGFEVWFEHGLAFGRK